MAEFKKFKEAVVQRFSEMKASGFPILYKEIDRTKIFELYLEGFTDPDEKQGHNCNCCKSFIRQYSGMVIYDFTSRKYVSLWNNLVLDELYQPSAKLMADYIESLPVTDYFYATESKIGTDTNFDAKNNTTWNHFALTLPSSLVVNKASYDSKRGAERTKVSLFKGSLEKITEESVNTVLAFIKQGALYRGEEFKKNVQAFQAVLVAYNALPEDQKEGFLWNSASKLSPNITGIKNTVIGTLLEDISEGKDEEKAVQAYESKVAPANYKRTTSLVSPRQYQDAEEKLRSLGLLDALSRRMATDTDLPVDCINFVDRSSKLKGSVFEELKKETLVNPKTYAKAPVVGIEDFLKDVLPKAAKVEALVQKTHFPNFVALIAPEKSSERLFKWDNGISWTYSGNVTDAIKERVKAAGGSVTGALRVSLAWNNSDDLDLHLKHPGKTGEIYYANKTDGFCKLDVDANAGTIVENPVENIIFSDANKVKPGKYLVNINRFTARTNDNPGFTVQIEYKDEIYDFYSSNNNNSNLSFTITNEGDIKFDSSSKLTSTGGSSIGSEEKWNVKTNTFVKVNNILLSPNYWKEEVGNKHYMFMLENCVADEKLNPFYNEFLRSELSENRKSLEVVASKLEVAATPNPLCGLGFSSTVENNLLVRVTEDNNSTKVYNVKIK